MKYEIRDKITLNNDIEYIVASYAVLDDKVYYYLAAINGEEELFLLEEENDLVEVTNPELIKVLLPIFTTNASEVFKELLKKQQ